MVRHGGVAVRLLPGVIRAATYNEATTGGGEAMKTIKVAAKTTLAEVLREADAAPVQLEVDGQAYEVRRVGTTATRSEEVCADQFDTRFPDPAEVFQNQDPAKRLEALQAARGMLAGLDIEAFRRHIKEARSQHEPRRRRSPGP